MKFSGIAAGALVCLWSVSSFGYWMCSEPNAPSIPSGSYADRWEMEAAQSEVNDYLDEVQAYKDCLLREMEEANSEAEDLVQEWRDAVDEYNSR